MNSLSMRKPNVHTQRFCAVVLAKLEKIKVHDMWIAAAMIHPGLKRLTFIAHNATRNLYENRVSGQVRRVLNTVRGEKRIVAFNWVCLSRLAI